MYYNYNFKNSNSLNKNEDLETGDKNQVNDNNKDDTNDTISTLGEAPLNSSEYNNLEDGEYLTSKGYTLKKENGISYVDGHLIVNKTYSLPDSYKTLNPYQAITSTTERCNNCIEKDVMNAFKLMQSDAKAVGLNIWIASGYRSYSYQNGLYNRYVGRDGKEMADTYSARPGHSEHQTGLCFDLNDVDDIFASTDEGIWVNENAYIYGFIIRYPKGKEAITGYQYESWHLRYVGKELAEKLYNNGNWLTMEEYFGLSSIY